MRRISQFTIQEQHRVQKKHEKGSQPSHLSTTSLTGVLLCHILALICSLACLARSWLVFYTFENLLVQRFTVANRHRGPLRGGYSQPRIGQS